MVVPKGGQADSFQTQPVNGGDMNLPPWVRVVLVIAGAVLFIAIISDPVHLGELFTALFILIRWLGFIFLFLVLLATFIGAMAWVVYKLMLFARRQRDSLRQEENENE